ncbi:MAG: DNA topoisomerase, partial [Candidatus Heimdallarchaeota archaeon]
SVPFLLRGRMLVAPGYLHIYPYERLREKFLPALSEGMELEVAAIQLREDKTRPPSPYTEPELIKTMDRRGLGTDATIPQHIATNVKRGYFTISPKRVIHPTARGIALIQSLEQSVAILVAPKIRASMERQIMTIQTGKKAYKAVVNELRTQIRQMYDQFAANIGSFATKLVQEQQATHSPSRGQRTRSAQVPRMPTSSNTTRVKQRRKSIPRSGRSPRQKMTTSSGMKKSSDLSPSNLPSRVKPSSHQRVGTCPKCGAETLYFEREVTRWLGCAAYPTCQWAFPLPASSKGELYLLPAQQCSLCCDPLLVYERKDGKSFKICAKCASGAGNIPRFAPVWSEPVRADGRNHLLFSFLYD